MQNQDRANYFYCVRVTNPDIHKNIQEALDWIVDKEPQYENFCYTPQMLHVTLFEVSLKTPDEIANASRVLQDMKSVLQANRPQTDLCLKGISDFHKKVMISKVEHGQDFRSFADLLKTKVKEAGIRVNESHDFCAHMTILKVSGMRARKAKVDNINPWLYVNLKDTLFGHQRVDSVHLCKMGYDRREDGFYDTPSQIFFS